MAKVIDMIGKRFEMVKVISRSKKRASNNAVMWNCVCDCGKKMVVSGGSLRRGENKSCGCANLINRHLGRVKKMERLHGIYMSCSDPWYIRASAVWQRIRIYKIPTDFKSRVELAVYLKQIAPKKCPVFNLPMTTGVKTMHRLSPSVDKIIPEKGYVKGNIQIISYQANKMKTDATRKELKQFAKWVMKGEASA